MKLLENKNILLCVTGSIAVYKSLELIRLYIKAGAIVKVIMSESSKKFVSKLTFETISQNEVLDEQNEDWSLKTSNNHIDIGKWADILVVAPITANTINKLSQGIADNLILQTALAYKNTKLLCPAANTNMMENNITQHSLKMLRLNNFKFVNSISKQLACRDIGNGAMAEIQDIFHSTSRYLLQDEYWENRKVVINGGGSVEKIDDVRFISNFSSGKMAVNLVRALYYSGADVSFVKTKTCKSVEISDINEITANNTKDMLNLISNELQTSSIKKPYFFAVAAISDYVPIKKENGKLKKDSIGDTWNLELKKNIDILDLLNKNKIYSIGFKAEMDKKKALSNATNMLNNKNLDAVCLNILDENNIFGSNTNSIELITKSNNINLQLNDKLILSFDLINNLKEQFSE